MLALIPTAWLWPAAGIAGLAMASAIGVQTLRVHSAQAALAATKQAWADERAVNTRVALEATTKARAEEQRRRAAQLEITNETERLASRARDAAVRGALAGDGLRQRAAAVAAACDRPASNPAPSRQRAPAAGPGALLADVLGRLEAAGRELAAETDRRGIAGVACERSFDALTPHRP